VCEVRKRQTYEPERVRLTSQKESDLRARKSQTYKTRKSQTYKNQKESDLRARKSQTYKNQKEPDLRARKRRRAKQPQRGWTMGNRGWLPEGEHLRIFSSSFLPSTSKGSNHAYSAQKNRSSISIPFFRTSLSTLHGVTSLFPLSYAARLRTSWSPPVIFPTGSYETLWLCVS